jgi:hypothetical protein
LVLGHELRDRPAGHVRVGAFHARRLELNPEETEGSKIAAQIRKRVSGMTREQRAEHFKRGMVKIYGGQWPKEAAGTGH